MKGYYTFEKKFNEKDLKYIDFSFTHFMKSNLFTSRSDLDEYLLKNQDEIFYYF